MENVQIAFGDRARISPTEETESLRMAGLTGVVQGLTTPSVTRVEVGKSSKDLAICVLLDGQATQLWFAEELLEFVDHGAGITTEIVGHKLMRDERGEWREIKPS